MFNNDNLWLKLLEEKELNTFDVDFWNGEEGNYFVHPNLLLGEHIYHPDFFIDRTKAECKNEPIYSKNTVLKPEKFGSKPGWADKEPFFEVDLSDSSEDIKTSFKRYIQSINDREFPQNKTYLLDFWKNSSNFPRANENAKQNSGEFSHFNVGYGKKTYKYKYENEYVFPSRRTPEEWKLEQEFPVDPFLRYCIAENTKRENCTKLSLINYFIVKEMIEHPVSLYLNKVNKFDQYQEVLFVLRDGRAFKLNYPDRKGIETLYAKSMQYNILNSIREDKRQNKIYKIREDKTESFVRIVGVRGGELPYDSKYLGRITKDELGFPFNYEEPNLTMRGRGLLGQWGVNQVGDGLVFKKGYDKDKKERPMIRLIVRKDTPDLFAIPGGMIDPGEKLKDGVVREILEETFEGVLKDLDDLQKKGEPTGYYKLETVDTNGETKIEFVNKKSPGWTNKLSEATVEEFSHLKKWKKENLIFGEEEHIFYSGYVKDPRNTLNAWTETKAMILGLNPETSLPESESMKAGDDALCVAWVDFEKLCRFELTEDDMQYPPMSKNYAINAMKYANGGDMYGDHRFLIEKCNVEKGDQIQNTFGQNGMTQSAENVYGSTGKRVWNLKQLGNAFLLTSKLSRNAWRIADFGEKTRGNFYVLGGDEIIKPIVSLIQSSNRVWLSIDAHPRNHVSFFTRGKDTSMGFPPHCVDGTLGQWIVREIHDAAVEIGKACQFFWKACDEEVDSFGAYPYCDCKSNFDYKKLWNEKLFNKLHDKCWRVRSKTGGFVAVPNSALFTNPKELFSTLYDTPPEQKMKHMGIKQYINEKDKTITDIYVCGLAGDFCVLDTCLNMKKDFKAQNKEINVHFLASHVQYAQLPQGLLDDPEKGIDPNKTTYPNRKIVDPSKKKDPNAGVWLNNPLDTFNALKENEVHVIYCPELDETLDSEKNIPHFAKYRYQSIEQGSESDRGCSKGAKKEYGKMEGVSLEDLKNKLQSHTSCLFVIDMQQDFALPRTDTDMSDSELKSGYARNNDSLRELKLSKINHKFEKSCYVCCFVSDQVIQIMENNTSTRYFVNANSYNLDGTKADETNSSKMYGFGNDGGGTFERLLAMQNVFFINPALVPLKTTETPLETGIAWISNICKQLSVYYGMSTDEYHKQISNFMKEYKCSLKFSLGKLKQFIDRIELNETTKQEFDQKLMDLCQTFKDLSTNQPEDILSQWGLFVKQTLSEMKEKVVDKNFILKVEGKRKSITDEVWTDEVRCIEKMYGAILPGMFKIYNDAMGMSYFLSAGLSEIHTSQIELKTTLKKELERARKSTLEPCDKDLSQIAKKTLHEMDPIWLSQQVKTKLEENVNFFREPPLETFDEIITDLEGDDTVAIMYGLMKKRDMKVSIQISEEVDKKYETILNKIPFHHKLELNIIKESKEMGNLEKVNENLGFLENFVEKEQEKDCETFLKNEIQKASTNLPAATRLPKHGTGS